MEPHELVKRPLKQLLINNFLGGIAWGLGATIGLSIVIALLTLLLKQINLVPIVGGFTSQVVNFVIATNPNLAP